MYYVEAFRAVRTVSAVQHSLLQVCSKYDCPCYDRSTKMDMQDKKIKVLPKWKVESNTY